MLSRTLYNDAVAFARNGSSFLHSELHGELHWRAVTAQALWLTRAQNLHIDHTITALLFGIFHDSRRENDGWDPEHGARAADALQTWTNQAGVTFPCVWFDTLRASLVMHDQGETTTDTHAGLGWDADRSVLGRVGVKPDRQYFSVVARNRFAAFIASGEHHTDHPPSWDDLWILAQGNR